MMKTKILCTYGDGKFHETMIEIPPIESTEIQVQNIMTGICRSDIDMMLGNFKLLPLHMQGHEGLAQVTAIGDKVTDISVGDVVATRGEPAYADVYNCKHNTYVKVPAADPKYIVEPVACAINCVKQFETQIRHKLHNKVKCLIIGSGFLASVLYKYMKHKNLQSDITVLGNSNHEFWGEKLTQKLEGRFDLVFDLNTRNEMFEGDHFNAEAFYVVAAEKEHAINSKLGNLLWHAVTVGFPSPRNKKFIECMREAVMLIETGVIDVAQFWSKGYNRHKEWQKAFADSVQRRPGFNRAYIDWRQQ